MRKGFLLVVSIVLFCGTALFSTPVVTPERFVDYLCSMGVYDRETVAPETVIFCYGLSDAYCMENFGPFEERSVIKKIYTLKGTEIAIMGRSGTGIGGPSLAIQMEKLIAFGTKRFILVGDAGALSKEFPIGTTLVCEKALKIDDLLSQLYAPEKMLFVRATPSLFTKWNNFSKEEQQSVAAWTFSSLFFETPERIQKARKLGCSVVEMEAATLYAAAQARGVEALALFVVSDQVTEEGWEPGFSDPRLNEAYPKLCDAIKEFCEQD